MLPGRLRKKAFRSLLSLVISPRGRLSIFSRPFVCHPDQVSEAQAEANARRYRREAICLKTRGKKEIPFGCAQGFGSPALVPRLRSRKNASSARDDRREAPPNRQSQRGRTKGRKPVLSQGAERFFHERNWFFRTLLKIQFPGRCRVLPITREMVSHPLFEGDKVARLPLPVSG